MQPTLLLIDISYAFYLYNGVVFDYANSAFSMIFERIPLCAVNG